MVDKLTVHKIAEIMVDSILLPSPCYFSCGNFITQLFILTDNRTIGLCDDCASKVEKIRGEMNMAMLDKDWKL